MDSLAKLGRSCAALVGLLMLGSAGGSALREWVKQDDFRASQMAIPPLGLSSSVTDLPIPQPETVAAVYNGVFRATVYYTPREDGFGEEAGFDMNPATKPGLGGKTFPKDFLRAVELEGFGKMKEAVDGQLYMRCCRGRWGYAKEPLGSKGQPLRALRSTAVGADYHLVRHQTHFRVEAEGMPKEFLNARWEICDTGSGLKPGQIDFYWGEDAPLGPGSRLSRPRGMPHPIPHPTVLVLR